MPREMQPQSMSGSSGEYDPNRDIDVPGGQQFAGDEPENIYSRIQRGIHSKTVKINNAFESKDPQAVRDLSADLETVARWFEWLEANPEEVAEDIGIDDLARLVTEDINTNNGVPFSE